MVPTQCVVGVDVGGTFTDLVVLDRATGQLSAHKVPSNRGAPDQAVMAALERAAVPMDRLGLVVHGTTVATNALLERRGAATAIITTAGFRDAVELGRTTRMVPNTLYDPYFRKAPPLVRRRDRHVIAERTTRTGQSDTAPDLDALPAIMDQMAANGIESVAICFINSYAGDAHERAVAASLRERFPHVCSSATVLNEVREYERFSTAIVNAYVMPLMTRYVRRLVEALRDRQCQGAFCTMASNGGLMSARMVSDHPVRTILSGPAAGVVAAAALCRTLGIPRAVTCDMGGTSTDVALIEDGAWTTKRETILQGMVVKMPQIDIATIGAGGGSIAWLDSGDALQLGPESAGAIPGPACYGRGGHEPTVTDANVVLGRLGAGQRLGDSLNLDAAAAHAALDSIAARRAITAAAMAEGVVRLASARMAAAIHEISVARGHDPRDFVLIPFGGAGPLHACQVADELAIPRVIVPPDPGAFCALGALCARLVKDHSRTLLRPLDADAVAIIERDAASFETALRAAFAEDGIDAAQMAAERQLDLRYSGQAHEITIAIPPGADTAAIAAQFEAAFEREFGRRDSDKPVELVNLRVVGSVAVNAPAFPTLAPGGAMPPPLHRMVTVDGATLSAQVLPRAALPRGARVSGPAVIEEMTATTYLPPGWALEVGGHGELILARRAPGEEIPV
jgi:N-methylhydantoinase A